MTTINTPDDLIRLVREDDAFREAMRRELLTAEILETPQRLANLERQVAELVEITKAINARLDRMDQTIAAIIEQTNAINRRLDGIEADVAETKSDITEMKGDISVIKRDINGLGESFRREVRAQSSYRGNYAQSAASASEVDIASLFAHRHGLEDVDTTHVPRNTLSKWLRENRDLLKSLNIRKRAMRTFLRPDIIASVEDLYSDNGAPPRYYIAVEASYTGEMEDIDKATDHAKIVRAVTGLEAYPVVVAVGLDDKMSPEVSSRLYDDVERFLDAGDPNAAFLY